MYLNIRQQSRITTPLLLAAIVYLNKILYQVAGNPAMSGAVKGKGVIMKKTCIEINEMMTDLMQQIENLNAKKVGHFL